MTQNAKHRRPKPQGKSSTQVPPPRAIEPSSLNPLQKWLVDHQLGDEEEAITGLSGYLTVQQLFAKITNAADAVTSADLFALSDLARAEIEYIRDQWPKLPVAQRRGLAEQLVDTAQEQLDLVPGEFFRITLRDEDAQVRLHAIEGLWEDEGDDLIGPYIQLLQNDPSVEVQAAAAAALSSYVLLGELEELQPALAIRVEQSLFEVLEDATQPLLVQCRALESVAYSSDEGIRQLIEDAYYSPYEELRLSALRSMGRSSDIRWRKMAEAELENSDPAMRAEAAIACGALEHKAVLNQLIQLLNDEEQIVRLSTIYALGHIGGKPARSALRQVAAAGENEEAEAAEEALEEMLFFSEMTALIDQLEGDADEENLQVEQEDDEIDEFILEDRGQGDNRSVWDIWEDEAGADEDLAENELANDELEGDELEGDELEGDELKGDEFANDKFADDELDDDGWGSSGKKADNPF